MIMGISSGIQSSFSHRYIILVMSLIREKNAKVKEILKVLGIEPILNNFAQAIRYDESFLLPPRTNFLHLEP